MKHDAAIFQMNRLRTKLLAESKRETERFVTAGNIESVLGESLFHEKGRIKRTKSHLFTRARRDADRKVWSDVQRRLSHSSIEEPRKQVLDQVLRHYGDEIAGRFNPFVYRLATQLVPFGFNWLLNAASVRRFVPWGMKEQLSDRLLITGEQEQLLKLARQGTVLLVPTHQSNIDSLLIGYLIYQMGLPPFAYGAGLNLFSNPVLSFFMSNLGAYTVDRQKRDPLYKAMLKNYSAALLQEGVHSIFFPGGGRSRSGAVEKHVKLGLLGTAIQAQSQILRNSDRKIFVVPMVGSYHFVLEAGSLVEEYLADIGKHRYLPPDVDGFQPLASAKFLWQFFSGQNNVTVRVGRAMDVFGNLVDDDGNSIGPNGTQIDVRRWLTTRGKLGPDADRDEEYTRELGRAITHRFSKENTVLSSHLVAFSLFEQLRARYRDLGFFRFLRIAPEQRVLRRAEFLQGLKIHWDAVKRMADTGQLHLSQELLALNLEDWAREGAAHLNYLQGAAAVKMSDDEVSSEDMQLLFYYRNRLTGYGMEAPDGDE